MPMASTSAGMPPLRSRDQQPPAWHTLPIADALCTLGSEAARWLTAMEAAARLARHGRNELPEIAGRRIARMVLDPFSDFMILVLIAAAIVSEFVKESKTQARCNRIPLLPITTFRSFVADLGFFHNLSGLVGALGGPADPAQGLRPGDCPGVCGCGDQTRPAELSRCTCDSGCKRAALRHSSDAAVFVRHVTGL